MTVVVFVIAIVSMLALIAYLHNTTFPHIDDVLADLDREDAEKNAAN